MKRQTLLALLIVLASATATRAQIQKGEVLLGATLGFYYNNNGNSGNPSSSSSNSNLAPRIGIAIGQNSVLGFKTSFGYGSSKDGGTNEQKYTSTTVGAGLYWKKFMPIKKQLGWYLEPNAGFSYAKGKIRNMFSETKSSSTTYAAGIVPGIYYQPLPKLLLSVDIGGAGYSYAINKGTGSSTSKSSAVNLSFLNTFTFGVDFLLTKGKG